MYLSKLNLASVSLKLNLFPVQGIQLSNKVGTDKIVNSCANYC